MENTAFKNQILTMTDGEVLKLNGVLDIIGFSDGEISLECQGGKVEVEGDNLKIESLSRDGGDIVIRGDIYGIYKTPSAPVKRGFFSRG